MLDGSGWERADEIAALPQVERSTRVFLPVGRTEGDVDGFYPTLPLDASYLEAAIMRVEEKRAALIKDLEDATIYTDGRRVREVQDEIERLGGELTALETEWGEYA